jgi:hypothetical protein
MKKLVVLALLLAGGMLWAQTAPVVPWSDVHRMDLGVTLDYMWAQNFGPGKEFSDRPILELKLNWMADDFTTVYVELEEGPLASQGDTGAFGPASPPTSSGAAGGYRNAYSTTADRGYNVAIAGLDRAIFTTDVAKWAKLPVPLVVVYGLNEWNNKDGIKVTKSEFEDFLGEADIRNWGAQIEVTPSPMVTIRSNWAWNSGVGPGSNPMFLVGAYGTVAPVTYEVTYFTHSMGFDKAWLEGGVEFNQDVTMDMNLAVMLAAQYDMADVDDDYGGTGSIPAYGWGALGGDAGTAPDSAYLLQAGIQIMFQKMAALGIAYRGAEDMTAGAVQVQGYFTPRAGDPVEVFVQAGLGLDGDVFDTPFDSAEVALRYTMGKVIWYLGFFWNPEFGRGIAKEWADFDIAGVPGGETTAIFMRGRVVL